MIRHPLRQRAARAALPAALLGRAALLAGATLLAGGRAQATSFTITDGKADEEISEVSRVYVDGILVGTFRLDDRTRELSMKVTVPDPPAPRAPSHDYALCGEITIRNQAGAPEIHEVSGQGVLRDPQDHVFAALGARDFTLFYLADPTDPGAVEVLPGHSLFCQTPVS